MHTDLSIRVMRPEEWAAARAVTVDAFGDDPTIGELLDGLRSSWSWEDDLSFVALRGSEIVGHVVFSHAFLDAPERIVDVLVLGPVGVRSDRQREGVGTALITEALRILSAHRPEPLVFLEGHPSYYPRFGFRQGHELGFVAPSLRIPQAAFMVYCLPAYQPWMRGTLVYPDVFWQQDAVGLRE
ncbi:MAG: N-acetyltransferase [Ilumatobacteraceae bacterium]